MSLLTTKSIHQGKGNVVYEISGSGRNALVFIHGWSCGKSLWRLQTSLLEKYRVILLDLPGHGASDSPKIDYSHEYFARAVEKVLSAESVETAVLVGHSMGGPVATMTLRLFPNRVSGIIYVDSFLHLPEHFMTSEERNELSMALCDDAGFEALIKRFMSLHTTDEAQKQILRVMMSTAKHVRTNATTTNSLPHVLREDEVFEIPALHMDAMKLGRNYDRWLYHLPQLQTQEWKGYGHFLFMEDVSRFNGEVDKFLTKHNLLQRTPAN
ncbi:hypothetical protein RBB50_010780 [Rhinocladiella similis]